MTEEQMILENTKLIYKAIQHMNLNWETEDEWQDYYDAGLIGLINGVKAFKNSKGVQLSTFLMPCIMNEIKHHLIIKTAKKRLNQHGKDISLNTIVGKDNEIELLEYISDRKTNIEEQIEKKLAFEEIVHKINSMKNIKNALVLKMYYGLEGFKPKTRKEISEILGVSIPMVRLRLTNGIKKLKEEMEKKDNG